MINFRHIIFLVFLANISMAGGQIDSIPPEPPTFNKVTINELTGKVDLSWSKSPSPDAVGYIVYYYYYDPQYQGGGYSAEFIDTIWGASNGYHSISRPYTSFRSESYVISAFDFSGRGAGKFSNSLSTIFLQSTLDTCNNRIKLTWNKYSSMPDSVLSYSIFQSVDGNPFTEIMNNLKDTSFFYREFVNDHNYCFIIKAILKSGELSVSNKSCILTKMQRPPQWINADYASIGDDNKVHLSFTIDPQSEINSFRLERKTKGTADFQTLKEFRSLKTSLSYTDNEADSKEIYYYRLAAINSCGIPVLYSNIASNIVLSVSLTDNKLEMKWNSYRNWSGAVGTYILYIKKGEEYTELSGIVPPDTIYSVSYQDIMYDVYGETICLMVKAFELSNPYGLTGESSSAAVCIPVSEKITIPDLFIPEGGTIKEINRYFKPVLSFTPGEYHLQITDLRRRIVFETRDFLERWDGRFNGELMPEGVYLWILRLSTPSGNSVFKTGTVTLIINRP